MKHRVFTFFSILTFGATLTVFPQAQPQQPPAAAAPPQEEPPPVLSVPKDYHYNARGRRDPFVNPVPKPAQKAAAPPPPAAAVRPPGLRGVLVSEAEIAGIVVSKEPSMNVITITAPGNRRYFARIGDSLFDAKIKSIRSDSVTFALTDPGPDSNGPREIVRKLRPLPGENK
jgi:hypothetical protein